jgi:ketosteroid isomerase-like protein
MQTIDYTTIVAEWIAAANSHDIDRYLSFFADDAVLDDPSVGRAFPGKEGVAEYFTAYFIGFDTQTRLLGTEPRGTVLHVEVESTGSFPGGGREGPSTSPSQRISSAMFLQT